MNAALPIALPAAERYSATRFEAFRICEASKPPYGGPPSRTTFPLGDMPGRSIDDALNAALAKCLLAHKDHLAIRVTDERGSQLHLFAIKRRSVPNYVPDPGTCTTKRVQPLYAAPVCVIDGALTGEVL